MMHTIRELESQLLIVSTSMTSLVLPTYQVQQRTNNELKSGLKYLNFLLQEI